MCIQGTHSKGKLPMIDHILNSPIPKTDDVRVRKVDESEDSTSHKRDEEHEAEDGAGGRESRRFADNRESSRVDVVSISNAARDKKVHKKPSKAGGDYSRGVFDRARKSGLHVMPPKKRSTPTSVEAMRRALRSVPPETREMLKIVANND